MKTGQTKTKQRFTFFTQVNPGQLEKDTFKKLCDIQEYFGLTNRKIGVEALKLFVDNWHKKMQLAKKSD